MLGIALFQPDIAGNVGTILRMGACFGVPVHIIEPCGFPFSDRKLKRSAMYYAEAAQVVRHASWDSFRVAVPGRIVLLSSKASLPLQEARFASDDILLMGSESAGVPDPVRDAADLSIRISLRPGFRSLNVAVAAGIALGEALRQTGQYP